MYMYQSPKRPNYFKTEMKRLTAYTHNLPVILHFRRTICCIFCVLGPADAWISVSSFDLAPKPIRVPGDGHASSSHTHARARTCPHTHMHAHTHTHTHTHSLSHTGYTHMYSHTYTHTGTVQFAPSLFDRGPICPENRGFPTRLAPLLFALGLRLGLGLEANWVGLQECGQIGPGAN
jgi:hypothetical protein